MTMRGKYGFFYLGKSISAATILARLFRRVSTIVNYQFADKKKQGHHFCLDDGLKETTVNPLFR